MSSWNFGGKAIHSILPTVKLFQCVGFNIMENKVNKIRLLLCHSHIEVEIEAEVDLNMRLKLG